MRYFCDRQSGRKAKETRKKRLFFRYFLVPDKNDYEVIFFLIYKIYFLIFQSKFFLVLNVLIFYSEKIISEPEVFFCLKKAMKTNRISNRTKFNATMEFYLFCFGR